MASVALKRQKTSHKPSLFHTVPYISISHISSIGPLTGSSSGASYVVSTITYLAVCWQGIDITSGGTSGADVLSVKHRVLLSVIDSVTGTPDTSRKNCLKRYGRQIPSVYKTNPIFMSKKRFINSYCLKKCWLVNKLTIRCI